MSELSDTLAYHIMKWKLYKSNEYNYPIETYYNYLNYISTINEIDEANNIVPGNAEIEYPDLWVDEGVEFFYNDWNPEENVNQALMIVEKILDKQGCNKIEITCDDRGWWKTEFTDLLKNKKSGTGYSKLFSKSICLAAEETIFYIA